MAYTVRIKREAARKLKSLSQPERIRLTEKIQALGVNPDDLALDVRKLEASPFWRLRVGDWRVIYDRQDDVKVIAIEKIKPRGDTYK